MADLKIIADLKIMASSEKLFPNEVSIKTCNTCRFAFKYYSAEPCATCRQSIDKTGYIYGNVLTRR